jgi:hypothetical protein
MEDLVRCVGYEGVTPEIEFLSKAAHISDLTGEKLTEHQVAEALVLVERRLGWPPPRLVVQAAFGSPPGYELLYEGGVGPEAHSASPVAALTQAMDWALGEINYIYKEHQASGKLAPLAGKPVHLASLNGRRGPAEQAKPRLLIGVGSKSFSALPVSSEKRLKSP